MNDIQKKPRKGTQSRRILDYMMEGNTVSSVKGIDKDIFNPIIMRLPNRIGELRHKYGYTIYQKEQRSSQSNRVKWQVYSLEDFEDKS